MITTFGGMVGLMANIVPDNPKCASCLHYLRMQSACEIGLNPSVCGDGSSPTAGYAPLDSTGPDPSMAEQPNGGTNPRRNPGGGTDQPLVPMITAHLGDASELLALSERMVHDLVKSAQEGCAIHAYNDGGMALNVHAAMALASARCDCIPLTKDDVAKAIHDELSNHLRKRVTVDNVKAFITKNKLM